MFQFITVTGDGGVGPRKSGEGGSTGESRTMSPVCRRTMSLSGLSWTVSYEREGPWREEDL